MTHNFTKRLMGVASWLSWGLGIEFDWLDHRTSFGHQWVINVHFGPLHLVYFGGNGNGKNRADAGGIDADDRCGMQRFWLRQANHPCA